VAYNFQTGDSKINMLKEYENLLREFYFEILYCPHWCMGENMTSKLKMAAVQDKSLCVLWCFETRLRYKKKLCFPG
jgi:hypothetical protein